MDEPTKIKVLRNIAIEGQHIEGGTVLSVPGDVSPEAAKELLAYGRAEPAVIGGTAPQKGKK